MRHRRAKYEVVRPGFGSTLVVENKGQVDEQLRHAIEAAHDAFIKACKAWDDKDRA